MILTDGKPTRKSLAHEICHLVWSDAFRSIQLNIFLLVFIFVNTSYQSYNWSFHLETCSNFSTFTYHSFIRETHTLLSKFSRISILNWKLLFSPFSKSKHSKLLTQVKLHFYSVKKKMGKVNFSNQPPPHTGS